MGRFVTWAVLVAACGKVGDAPLPPPADAALDAFSCSSSKLACAGTCVDPMTDKNNCGGCGVACESSGETCQAGTCVDMFASCADIVAANPQAADGTYTFVNGTKANCDFSGTTSCATIHGSNSTAGDGFYALGAGSGIWCNMTEGGFNIYGLAYGMAGATIANYHQLSLFDYQSADLGSAFIAMFNQQGNVQLAATWTVGNCCFKYDTSTNFLQLGSANGANSYVLPTCQNPVLATTPFFIWTPGPAFTAQSAPLPANFFTTFPATGQATSSCSVNANPAFFWKVTP
jgi:hypothetical protein